MMKCVGLMMLLSIIMLHENVYGKPQDIPEAAILAFAQIKNTFDNGAAASDKKEFEFLGAKVKSEMDAGFGDAIRSKRNVENAKGLDMNSFYRTKRFANVADIGKHIVNSKEKFINKRAAESNSIAVEDYDNSSSSSSSSSSSESESESENIEKRKRSASFDQFTVDLENLYSNKY